MQGQWEEPIKVLAYRTSFGERLEANDRKKKERKCHNGWLLHGLLPSRRSTTRVFELSSFLHYGTMRVLLSLKQSKGYAYYKQQRTTHRRKTQDERGTRAVFFPSHSLPPVVRHPQKVKHTSKQRDAEVKKRWRAKMPKAAYTHWMITTSRVQLQQRMYDAREQRRGIKPAWQTALVDRTKRAGEQEGKNKKKGEEEMPFVLCPQVMPALFTNDCCRKRRDEHSIKRK